MNSISQHEYLAARNRLRQLNERAKGIGSDATASSSGGGGVKPQAPQKTAAMLSTRESRARWFKIMDRSRAGKISETDLMHFAPKLELAPAVASGLFHRLDRDHDGFLLEVLARRRIMMHPLSLR